MSGPGLIDQEAFGEAAARETAVTDMRLDCRRAQPRRNAGSGTVRPMLDALLALLVPPLCAGCRGPLRAPADVVCAGSWFRSRRFVTQSRQDSN